VIDPADAFDTLCPLKTALFQVEIGGLILAVHDLRPLENGEGYYVVSSVRGTPEFLRKYPPRRRWVNPELSALDVARQPGPQRMMESHDLIEMAHAAYEGVQVSWWLIVPRRFFEIKEGKRVEIETTPLFEPKTLDDLPRKVRLPLRAWYWDAQHRDAQGQQEVSRWVEVPMPADHRPTTLQDVAGRTRRDLLLARHGSEWDMYGFTAGAITEDRAMDHFEPDKITDRDFAAAVQRVIDYFRTLDRCEVSPPVDGAAPPR
jgi:hypothetical protein